MVMANGGAVSWREIEGGFEAWGGRLRVVRLGGRWCIVADGKICRG